MIAWAGLQGEEGLWERLGWWTYCTVPKTRNIYSQKLNSTASFPISTFMHLGASDIFPRLVFFGISISCMLHERTIGLTAGAEKRAGNCCQAVAGGSSLPSPLLLRLSPEFTEMTNIQITDHKWKQLILVVNFLLVGEWMRFQIRHLCIWDLTGPSFAVCSCHSWDSEPNETNQKNVGLFQYWGRILGRNWDKSLKSFPPWNSSHIY